MRRDRSKASSVLAGVLACCAVVVLSGCDELTDEFRSAAAPSLKSGTTAVLTGLVDGAFAVFEPDGDSTSDTSSGSGS